MARKPFALRLDERVMDAVERDAEAHIRSVNAHIEALLREALAARKIRVPPGNLRTRAPNRSGSAED